ncbi:MAG TPA: GNAT family N-acetyltransferase [Devosia sp.]|nr:GNAT family N-acetyltransferase [Devosia sp.]
MVDISTFEAPSAAEAKSAARAAAPAVSVAVSHDIGEVEAAWRALAAAGIASPGQSFDFIRLWVYSLAIPADEQFYVVASLDGRPAALLPLHRKRRGPVRLYSWFPGSHVGAGAPLVDAARLAALLPEARAAFWRTVLQSLGGADLAFLQNIPALPEQPADLFGGLGRALPAETLYRAHFASWQDADTTQRSKSRRKHDRQHTDKLNALGEVSFETIAGDHPDAPAVLDEMFRQRARRFEAMGVANPFAPADIARFYRATIDPSTGVRVQLNVLKVDGAIVAVRYNIVEGDRLFCLISSMSDDERLQAGSPGKQCLLRVMQTVFDEGFAVFDMGAGFTDEKRHWCNEQIPLANHYAALSPLGSTAIALMLAWQATRTRIKSDPRLHRLVKTVRSRLGRKASQQAAAAEAD